MKYFAPSLFLLTALAFAQPVVAHDTTDSVVRGTKHFGERVLISGLVEPWEVTWGPDDRLWVTERTGKRVSRIDPVSGDQKVAITLSEVSAPGAQDGLLGMALHPELLRGTGNEYVYVAYTYVDEGEARLRRSATRTVPTAIYTPRSCGSATTRPMERCPILST